MKKYLAYATLLATIAVAGCTDSSPTTPLVRGNGAMAATTFSADIDQMVVDYFPTGLETATGAKWSTVKFDLASGNVTMARKHLGDLTKFIALKTGNISPRPGETQKQSAAQLVLAMS